MKDIVKKNNKLVVVLLIVLIIIMGSSFAWLSNEKYGTNISYIRAKDLGDGKIKLIDCNEDLTLENAVPISAENGLAQEKSCKVVIDNTKNDVDLEYTIYLDDKKIGANEERMLDKYVRYSFTSENEEETAENTKLISATGTNPNRILKTDYVRQKEQKVYYLKVWMDYDADQNAMNKVFSTKLRVEITQQRAQVLTIDPNGGTYKGDSKKVVEKLAVGEEKILEEPKYEGYTFRGWEISNNTTKIENNKLIMGKGDTTITATWNISEDSVARINNKYYTSLKNAIDAALENDTITIIKNIDETVINNKKIAIDLNGFTINGQKDTTITNNGDLTIKGKGTINNNEGTALDNNGTLTLGEDDGEVKKEDININGKIGIDQKKIFNFYDGTITGKIGINGSTTTKPEGYFVFVDHDEKTNTQKVYLITKTTSAVAMLDNVLYMNLQDAINVEEMMQAGKSIGIIRDCELAYTISIEKGKNIVIDIEGKNVATGYTITNNGNLTIKDSSKEKGILKPSTTIINNGDLNISDISIIETTDSDVIENKNNLMINSSTITALNSYVIKNSGSLIMLDDNTKLSSNKYALYNNSENTSTIRGGTVSGIYNEGNLKVEKVSIIDTNNSNYIVNSTKDIQMDSVTISNVHYGIRIESGTALIQNSTISSDEYSVTAYRGTTTLQNNTINANGYGVRNEYGKVNILGGNYTSKNKSSLYIYGGSTTINDGIFTGKTYAIDSTNGSGGGVQTINGGTINGFNLVYHTVVMNGGIINGQGLNIQSGNFNLLGGKISGSTYGIKNNNGEITLGNNENEVDTTNPIVIGETYGIYTTGRFNFYDGKVYGKTEGYYGKVSTTTDSYEIINGSEEVEGENYNYSTLSKMNNFVKVGNIEFNSLQKAIDSIDTEGTVTFIDNGQIKGNTEVPTGKNITINLSGYKLTTTKPIINSGVLSLKDESSNPGGIVFNIDTGDAITNKENATLNINNISINANIASYQSSLIENSGTTNIEKLEATVPNSRGIYNSKGSLVVNNTKLNVKYYALYINKGTVNIKDNEFKTVDLGIYNISGNIEIMGGSYTSTEKNAVYIYGGSTTINDGIFTGKTYAIASTNGSGGGVQTINGGTINGFNLVYHTVVMNDGIINGQGLNIQSGNFSLLGGKISGSTYGIKNNNGEITLGSNENEVDTTNPIVIGETYGIYTISGNFNFYDGKIYGKTAGYYGTISTLADNFMMDASTETINNEVYITNYLSEQGNIIQNGDKQYKNVQTAIDESTNGDTLTFIDDTLIHYPLTVSNDDNITLDLAGHNVKMTKTITNLGTLNINDTLNSGSINLLNSVKLFVNSGILKISNINITNDVTTSPIINSSGSSKLNLENINMTSLNGIVIGNDSIATIDNSNITVQNSSLITSSGSININNGTYKAPTVIYQNQSTLDSSIMATIIGTNQSIYNYSNSFSVNKSDLTGQVINSKNLTLSNTTINSNIRNNNNSNLEINNNSIVNLAKLTSALAGLYNAGSTTINDVTLNSSINNLNYSTTYQIENRGTLNATRLTSNITDFPTINRREVYGIYNNGGEANLNEYNAIINDESINAAKIYGIYNANNAKVNFNSGTLSIYGGRETYGIYSGGSNSNIKMLSGNILVNQAILGYGIYINNGEVILGSQDGKVSITDPSISSICSTTGVGIRKVNGYLKYYDGKILGSTSAKPETTTDVEYGYEARNHKDESGNDYCILEYME